MAWEQDEYFRVGTTADRPSPHHVGRLYFDSETQTIYRDTGQAWEALADTSGGGAHTHDGSDIDTGVVGVTHGGTGLTGVAQGDLLYSNAVDSLATLGSVAEGAFLMTGSAGMPTWSHAPVLWQQADTIGFEVRGYDDQSGRYFKLAINSNGAANFNANGNLSFNTLASSSSDINFFPGRHAYMSLSAGNRFRVRNWGANADPLLDVDYDGDTRVYNGLQVDGATTLEGAATLNGGITVWGGADFTHGTFTSWSGGNLTVTDYLGANIIRLDTYQQGANTFRGAIEFPPGGNAVNSVSGDYVYLTRDSSGNLIAKFETGDVTIATKP